MEGTIPDAARHRCCNGFPMGKSLISGHPARKQERFSLHPPEPQPKVETMSAREDRTPSWVRAVVSNAAARIVYEDNMAAAQHNRLAGGITESELDTLQYRLKQNAVRRYHQAQRATQGRRAA